MTLCRKQSQENSDLRIQLRDVQQKLAAHTRPDFPSKLKGNASKDVSYAGNQLSISETSWAARRTGGKTWDSAYVLATHMEHRAIEFKGKRVLELGSGTGLAGIAAAVLGAQVILTDCDVDILNLHECNIEANQNLVAAAGGTLESHELQWGDNSHISSVQSKFGPFDWVIASDVLYLPTLFHSLELTLRELAPERVLMAFPDRPNEPPFKIACTGEFRQSALFLQVGGAGRNVNILELTHVNTE